MRLLMGRQRLELAERMIEEGFDMSRFNMSRCIEESYGFDEEQKRPTRSQVDAIKFMLRHGCNIDCADFFGKTSLNYSIRYRDTKSALMLIEHGANLSPAKPIISPLDAAILDNNYQMVQLLLSKGAVVNHAGTSNYLSLKTAFFDCNIEIAKLLLEHGADVNPSGEALLIDAKGYTGMAGYSFERRVEMMKLLLRYGANVNATNFRGDDALFNAVDHDRYGRNFEFATILVKAGAYLDRTYRDGQKTLVQTAESDEVRAYLRRHGAK